MPGMTVSATIDCRLMGFALLPGLGDPLMAPQAEGGVWFDQIIGYA